MVAAIAGGGELLGCAVRFGFGYAADRTGRYWPITAAGYTLQMAVVLLAPTGSSPAAAVPVL